MSFNEAAVLLSRRDRIEIALLRPRDKGHAARPTKDTTVDFRSHLTVSPVKGHRERENGIIRARAVASYLFSSSFFLFFFFLFFARQRSSRGNDRIWRAISRARLE